jgi:hypothetical protein
MGGASSAHAYPPERILQLRSEYNDAPASLSNNNPAGPDNPDMPAVGITFTCRCLDNTGSIPLAGETIEFIEDPFLGGPHITCNPTSAVTGANGKCNTVVWAIAGASPPGESWTRIFAQWRKPDGTVGALAELGLTLVSEWPGVGNTAGSKPTLANPMAIRVWYENLTVMVPYANATNPAWTVAGRIGFVGNPDWQIRFREEYFPTQDWYMLTTYPDPFKADMRLIQYNMYQLDGDWPAGPGLLTPAWPTLAARHHVQSDANHEVGHALVFGHNTVSRKALMYDNGTQYFVWRTIGYQNPYESLPLLGVDPTIPGTPYY